MSLACCKLSCHVPVVPPSCHTLSCHVPGLLYSPVMSIVPLSCHVPGLLYITLSCPLYPHPVMSLACCTPVQPCLWPVVPPSCHDHGLFYPSPVMSLPYCAPVLVSLPSTPNPGLLGQWTGTPWKWAPSDTSRRHWLPIVHPPCVSQGKGASVMGKWMHIRGFSSCKGSPYVQNIHFLTDTRVWTFWYFSVVLHARVLKCALAYDGVLRWPVWLTGC